MLRRHLPPVLHRRSYALLWLALLAMGLGSQMVAVAVGWQVYAVHRDPLDLGLIGLAEFLPLPLLALPAGQLSDRFPRRLVLAVGLAVNTAVAAVLLVVTLHGATQVWPFFALALVTGVAHAIGWPSGLWPLPANPSNCSRSTATRQRRASRSIASKPMLCRVPA